MEKTEKGSRNKRRLNLVVTSSRIKGKIIRGRHNQVTRSVGILKPEGYSDEGYTVNIEENSKRREQRRNKKKMSSKA